MSSAQKPKSESNTTAKVKPECKNCSFRNACDYSLKGTITPKECKS